MPQPAFRDSRVASRPQGLRCAGLLLVLAGALAAEDVWGGSDLIILTSGEELSGSVVTDKGEDVVVDAGFGRVTIERARIREIRRGQGTATQRAPAVSAPEPAAGRRFIASSDTPWTFEAGLTWGMHTGSVDGSGTMLDGNSATTQATSLSLDVSGTDPTPGAYLRLTAPIGKLPIAGLQFAVSSAGGEAVSMQLLSLEAVCGTAWTTAGGVRWQAIAGLGWGQAGVDRDLTMRDGAGVVLDKASTSDTASGPVARLEAGPSWKAGSWRLGVLGGLSWCSLSGDSDWTSDTGRFTGSDSIDVSAIGLYLGGTAAISW